MDSNIKDWLRAHPEEAQVLEAFTDRMARELMANSNKGDRQDWVRRGARDAINELHWHAAKLSVSVKDLEYGIHTEVVEESVSEFAADVAVCSLMVADTCGVLEIPKPTKVDHG